MSNAPLEKIQYLKLMIMTLMTHPGSTRERSRVVVHVAGALHVADGKYTRSNVSRESPIPNGLTAVAGYQNQLKARNKRG
jgi:hypothetical protein